MRTLTIGQRLNAGVRGSATGSVPGASRSHSIVKSQEPRRWTNSSRERTGYHVDMPCSIISADSAEAS